MSGKLSVCRAADERDLRKSQPEDSRLPGPVVTLTASATKTLPERLPNLGELVQVRSRRWLVEEIVTTQEPGDSAVVRLACADDDAQGQALDVFWNCEPDRLILEEEGWADLAAKGFDSPAMFAAFLHTLRWNCVTATDPNLFQSPFRAGIKIDAYQMEPLRKALRLPRVNLFIADDTGLGKTIEAGLIARELLLRRKAKVIVVAAPPSVLEQWKAELEERFGLIFEILDRGYLTRVRRERGFGVNPWRTHSRFLISHNLLTDPAYTDPLREWLGDLLPGSLLIIDEAHHAAPSSGGNYGIETKFTRAVRDLAARFEHRLFLSATPHNGHSNSFSTLLELLDPYRFTRGVKIRPKALEEIMVRRLKEDIRAVQGGFPLRQVVRVELGNLPAHAPELVLSRLLDQYRTAREERFASTSRRTQAAAGLLVVGLQQRLLSSIEAFARSLKVHRATVERQQQKSPPPPLPRVGDEENLFTHPAGADDERADWTDEELDAEDSTDVEAITTAAEAAAPSDSAAQALKRREKDLLDQMQKIAEEHRHLPDAKLRYLIDWIREHLCPQLPSYGETAQGAAPKWRNDRVIIFTENREGTKRYLKQLLEQAIEGTDRADERIEVIDGLTSSIRRREIQRRFNTDPSEDPLRILLATDAAREGLNFQAHCADLFHFDLPWNPGRIEQRNGRIDRKLQPAPEVRCHYFVLPQREEDRVLDVLVRKTETIRKELGSLSKVIDDDIERQLGHGIRHRDVERMAREIEATNIDAEKRRVTEEELDAARDRRGALTEQIERCRGLLEKSREATGFESAPFRAALSCSLELLGAKPLVETSDEHGHPAFKFPQLDQRATDPSWAATLDSLRAPRKQNQKLADWRREAPIRPVVFEDAGILTEDTVHLHLDQRVAQRLLARFRTQGFIHNDLSRACLAQSRDSIPRVILLGRLSLYGRRAERLHEELVPLTARWIEPSQRKLVLEPYRRDAEAKTLQLLDDSLAESGGRLPNEAVRARLLAAAPRDIEELLPRLQPRAEECASVAIKQLHDRGEAEARSLRETLEHQRDRVREELAKVDRKSLHQLSLDLNDEERRQLDSDIRSWRSRLEQFERDLNVEPERIRDFYTVKAKRIEPVGLVYLWPESN